MLQTKRAVVAHGSWEYGMVDDEFKQMLHDWQLVLMKLSFLMEKLGPELTGAIILSHLREPSFSESDSEKEP